MVVVCTSGFAELGDEGRKQQARLLDVARASGTRLLGPNCIGVLNVVDRFVGCPTFNLTEDFTPGVISVLTHSGGMGTVIVNQAQARRIGIRAMVSLGNEADLEMAELVDTLVDDPGARCLCLFVEQLRDGPRFVAAAERARAAGIPTVVVKSGRSEAGARTVLGHTGALAGDAAVFSAVLRQLGAVEGAASTRCSTRRWCSPSARRRTVRGWVQCHRRAVRPGTSRTGRRIAVWICLCSRTPRKRCAP